MRQGIYGKYKVSDDLKREVMMYIDVGKSVKEVGAILKRSEWAIYKIIGRNPEAKEKYRETHTVRWAHPKLVVA